MVILSIYMAIFCMVQLVTHVTKKTHDHSLIRIYYFVLSGRNEVKEKLPEITLLKILWEFHHVYIEYIELCVGCSQ